MKIIGYNENRGKLVKLKRIGVVNCGNGGLFLFQKYNKTL